MIKDRLPGSHGRIRSLIFPKRAAVFVRATVSVNKSVLKPGPGVDAATLVVVMTEGPGKITVLPASICALNFGSSSRMAIGICSRWEESKCGGVVLKTLFVRGHSPS